MTGYQSKKASAQDKLTQWLEALHHSQEPESVDAQPDDPTGQAPCVRHCESTAYEIVIRGLKGDIERLKAAQRTWVVSGDVEDSNTYLTQPAQRVTAQQQQDGMRGPRPTSSGAQTARPAQERNFCPRCGKRTADLTVIHTCTPPQKNT